MKYYTKHKHPQQLLHNMSSYSQSRSFRNGTDKCIYQPRVYTPAAETNNVPQTIPTISRPTFKPVFSAPIAVPKEVKQVISQEEVKVAPVIEAIRPIYNKPSDDLMNLRRQLELSERKNAMLSTQVTKLEQDNDKLLEQNKTLSCELSEMFLRAEKYEELSKEYYANMIVFQKETIAADKKGYSIENTANAEKMKLTKKISALEFTIDDMDEHISQLDSEIVVLKDDLRSANVGQVEQNKILIQSLEAGKITSKTSPRQNSETDKLIDQIDDLQTRFAIANSSIDGLTITNEVIVDHNKTLQATVNQLTGKLTTLGERFRTILTQLQAQQF